MLFATTDYCSSDKDFIIQLYQNYNRLMFSVAKRYITDCDLCEDIIQDSIEKLIKKVEVIKPMERCILAAYIVSTVKNTAINYIKREKKFQNRMRSFNELEEVDVLSDQLSMDEYLTLLEKKANLQRIWKLLSTEDQLLFEGKYILGYTDAELAVQLGCKADSIRMKMTRARRRALNLISELEGENNDKA